MTNGKKCIIWGTGELGRQIKKLLENSGVVVVAYTDNDLEKRRASVEGIPVYEQSAAIEECLWGKVSFIVVAIKNQNDRNNVAQQLYNSGVENIKMAPGYLMFYDSGRDGEDFLKELEDIRDVRPVLDRLEVHAAERCNLNCRGCGHFSNIIDDEEEPFLNLSKFEQDIQQVKKYYQNILQFTFLGGEPLLNKELNVGIEIVRKAFPNADILVTTNGLLIEKMSEKIIQSFKDNKAVIQLTAYPPTVEKLLPIQKFLYKNELNYIMTGSDIQHFFKFLNTTGGQEIAKNHAQCLWRGCHILRDGKIYSCVLPSVIHKFNKKFDMSINQGAIDYLNLYDFEGNGWDMNKQFSEPLNMCKWCNTSRMELLKWQTGGNISIEDWLNYNEN